MVSLITRFFKTWRKHILTCVSPPLVGVVLALCFGFNSYAFEEFTPSTISYLDSGGNLHPLASGYTEEYSLLPTSIDVIDISSGSMLGDLKVTPSLDGGTKLGFSFNGAQGTLNYPAYNISGSNVSFEKKYNFVFHYDYDLTFSLQIDGLSNCNINTAYLPLNLTFKYKPFSAGAISPTDVPSDYLTFDNFVRSGAWIYFGDIKMFGSFTENFKYHFKYSRAVSNVNSFNVSDATCYLYTGFVFSGGGSVFYHEYSSELLGQIEQNTDKIAQQQQDYHDQDKNDATSAGSEMQGMAGELETVKSKWEILWYPIEFTNRVMGAFQGSSSARYASAYADVSGYRYNEDSGLLEPIVLNIRSSAVARANSGTMIHIPAYTLPVLDVQVWEGADYDLSTLKEQFPDAFNLLYVVVTVLEVMWFVSFLRDKYEEVFG